MFTYEKSDDSTAQTARLNFRDAIFVAREKTGDYQTTYGLIGILNRNGNKDDIVAYLEERNLPLDEIGRDLLADRILQNPRHLDILQYLMHCNGDFNIAELLILRIQKQI